ncbi:Wzz/FepE/Etk N-terminal domain-containing protein [Thiomicrorhabdus sp.]|uniref:Wzz/FepE/Etk N-terminal domain-containing protein n=1 Tax=Thiomicrorhabdus sp. TaxID=2039724 RepID=UPI003566B503
MGMSKNTRSNKQEEYWQNDPRDMNDDEIDLRELFSVLSQHKWFIAFISFGLALVTAIVSFQIPNQYQAQVVMVPVNSNSSGGMASLASKYGGLASMAGIDLPESGGDRTQQAISVLKSRKFINDFILRHKLKPELFSVRWDSESASWREDSPDVLQRLKGVIGLRQGAVSNYEGQEKLALGEPSLWQAYKLFSNEIMRVSDDKKSGVITLSIQWYNPVQARDWANQMVDDLNKRLRNEMIANSEKTIKYLKEQIKQTNLLELREILFGLIEEHVKNITLAKTNTEYVFKVIDPAVVPEEKSKPKRGLMVAVSFLLGLMLAIFIVLIRNWKAGNAISGKPSIE